jgi:hypothetical protein
VSGVHARWHGVSELRLEEVLRHVDVAAPVAAFQDLGLVHVELAGNLTPDTLDD